MNKVTPQKKSKGIAFRIFSVFLSIIIVSLTIWFIYQISNLNILPMKLFLPVAIMLVLVDSIFLLLINFSVQKILSKIFMSFLVILLGCAYGFGNYYLLKTSSMLNTVTSNEDKQKNTVSLITMNTNEDEELVDFEGKKIAVLRAIDTQGTEECLKQIKKEKVSFETQEVTSVREQVQALYDGHVDGIILNESMRATVQELDGFSNFTEETKVIFKAVYYTEKENVAKAVDDITTHPFTILISGNDTYGDIGEVSRSDVNMLVTVNPVTATVLMTSIPRDYYVPQVCDTNDACLYGQYDKLTHSGLHGVNTTKSTIEGFLGIEINYSYRVNFSSVIDLVNSLDGITVNIEPGLAVESFWTYPEYGVTEGENFLDGPKALALARERYAYEDGDMQRNRNQQLVLTAIIEKATSPTMIKNYAKFMDALSGAFETDMTQDEISALIQYQLDANPKWKIEHYQLEGYGDMRLSAEMGSAVSVMIPNQGTIDIAKQKIEAVLSGESSDIISTENVEEYYLDIYSSVGITYDDTTYDESEYYEEEPIYQEDSSSNDQYYDENIDGLYTDEYYDPNQNQYPVYE